MAARRLDTQLCESYSGEDKTRQPNWNHLVRCNLFSCREPAAVPAAPRAARTCLRALSQRPNVEQQCLQAGSRGRSSDTGGINYMIVLRWCLTFIQKEIVPPYLRKYPHICMDVTCGTSTPTLSAYASRFLDNNSCKGFRYRQPF